MLPFKPQWVTENDKKFLDLLAELGAAEGWVVVANRAAADRLGVRPGRVWHYRQRLVAWGLAEARRRHDPATGGELAGEMRLTGAWEPQIGDAVMAPLNE